MERALLARPPGGHRAGPHLQRPRSAATGAEQAAEGEAREPRTAQSLPFPPVRREGGRAPSTKPKRKRTQEAGQGAPCSQSRRRWCLSTYLQSSRECPGTAGGGDARASPGASKWLSTDQVLCSCSVRDKELNSHRTAVVCT